MSCNLRKNSLQKPLQRSKYDIQMMERYTPFPGVGTYPKSRTKFDMNLQQEWCPKCVETYKYLAPITRTKFDMELQKKWCPTCNNN